MKFIYAVIAANGRLVCAREKEKEVQAIVKKENDPERFTFRPISPTHDKHFPYPYRVMKFQEVEE